MDGLQAAINLDAAFALLQPEPEPEDEAGVHPDTDRAENPPPEPGQMPGDEH